LSFQAEVRSALQTYRAHVFAPFIVLKQAYCLILMQQLQHHCIVEPDSRKTGYSETINVPILWAMLNAIKEQET
jgi:hypothetical protein